uniref:Uncharacterized protein n=1 Tax=Fagus sylvatica TaxID=28930 RepID=A0A2N9GIS9_FAGSY
MASKLARGEILIPVMAIVEVPGEESRTSCHLQARELNKKLVNGLPSSNKGYDKDYLRVSGEWFTGGFACWSSYGYPDPTKVEVDRRQLDVELVERVLSTNICVDERGEARSDPLLLRKGRTKGTGVGKEVKETNGRRSDVQGIYPTLDRTSILSPTTNGQDLGEPDREEELQPRKKRGRTEPFSIPAEGPSSHSEAWDPALLFGPNPISIRDTILDNSNNEASAQVAHGLAFAACLPEDMKHWANTQPGAVFRDITRGLMMATQGILSMEARVFRLTEKLQKKDVEHEKSMSEVLESAADSYKKLEDGHFKNINIMKEAEGRARTEEEKRIQMEAELTGMREKMKKLESECVLLISKAHKEGMEEGLEKGKDLGKEGAMGEVATQFKMVYNSGFRNGWKSALSKTKQPETPDLYLRAKTPLPYPDAGLNNSDDEAEDEDDEGDEEEKEEEKRRRRKRKRKRKGN